MAVVSYMGLWLRISSLASPLRSACLLYFHRVDNLSKYFRGLKEQEKRFKVMEAQVSNSFIGICIDFRIASCFSP